MEAFTLAISNSSQYGNNAYIAPGYEAHGFAANAGMTVLVFAAVWPVSFASPWRHRWSSTSG